MIEVAKRKADERKIDNIKYTQATIFDVTYERESFDVVLAFNILHLLEDLQKVLQRINDLLKPGGLFISSTACMGDKTVSRYRLLLFPLSVLGIVPSMKFLKRSELDESITKGNFQIIETGRMDHKAPIFLIVAKKLQRTYQEEL